jgi:hypothetical protein
MQFTKLLFIASSIQATFCPLSHGTATTTGHVTKQGMILEVPPSSSVLTIITFAVPLC